MNTKYPGYEQVAITVGLVILTVSGDTLKVMLVKRVEEPFEDGWSLPGGFLKRREALGNAALRVLKEKAGVEDVYVEQLYTFGDLERDPRARVITVAYFALIPWKELAPPPSDKVSDLMWTPVNRLPKLAFDHKEIVIYAVQRLRAKAGYSNIVYALMPRQFRLSELQKMYEIIMDKQLDKRNFRKRMLASGLLHETGRKDIAGAHRPAMLYRFKKMEIALLD
ncbi:MAG TPA: NUDIX domain-containing protein [Anaerolineales bacterium]|jgi:8-oxo-dGTP diphosphatase|nr:NUDIX domain-containing protein [Anaerolineales bacterium]